MVNVDDVVPKQLQHKVCAAIQFGSSLYSTKAGDIDICIVIKRGEFFSFLEANPFRDLAEKFDISLMKEEEIYLSPFRFGSHGSHLILSLQSAVTLLGENVFLNIPNPSISDVKASILDRLYDYLYEVRKSETNSRENNQLQKRWGKFQRLSLFLLTDSVYSFPKILQLTDSELKAGLEMIGLVYSKQFTHLGFERIWQAITEKSSLS